MINTEKISAHICWECFFAGINFSELAKIDLSRLPKIR